MKDPCENCLVNTMCSEVCGAKTNYGNLLDNAITKHRGFFFQDTRNDRRKHSYHKYRKMRDKHRKGVVEIETRCRNLGKYNG